MCVCFRRVKFGGGLVGRILENLIKKKSFMLSLKSHFDKIKKLKVYKSYWLVLVVNNMYKLNSKYHEQVTYYFLIILYYNQSNSFLYHNQ